MERSLFPLPNELIENIFLFLPYRDIFSCYLSVKERNFFSTSLWRRKAKRDLGISYSHFNLARTTPPYVRYYELYRMLYPKFRKVPKIFLQGLSPREGKELQFYYFLSRKTDYPGSSVYLPLFGDILDYYLYLYHGKSPEREFIEQSTNFLSHLPTLYSYYSLYSIEETIKANFLSQIFLRKDLLDLYYAFTTLVNDEGRIIFLANLIAFRKKEVERYLLYFKKIFTLDSLYDKIVFYRGSFKTGRESLSVAAAFSNSPELIKRFLLSPGKEEKLNLVRGFIYSPNVDFFYLAREFKLKKEELAGTFHPDINYL